MMSMEVSLVIGSSWLPVVAERMRPCSPSNNRRPYRNCSLGFMVSSYTLDTERFRATLNRSPLIMAYLLGASKSHAFMAWNTSSRNLGSPICRSCSGTMYSSSHVSASGGKRGSWKSISLPPLPRQQPLYDRSHARRNHRRPRLDLALWLGVAVFHGVDACVVLVQLALKARPQAVESLVGLDRH